MSHSFVCCYFDVCYIPHKIQQYGSCQRGTNIHISALYVLCLDWALFVSQSADCSWVSPVDAWRVMESDERKGLQERRRKIKAQSSLHKRHTQGKRWKEREKLKIEGQRGSKNGRPWLCVLSWLDSTLFCLFLLYFYHVVWHCWMAPYVSYISSDRIIQNVWPR